MISRWGRDPSEGPRKKKRTVAARRTDGTGAVSADDDVVAARGQVGAADRIDSPSRLDEWSKKKPTSLIDQKPVQPNRNLVKPYKTKWSLMKPDKKPKKNPRKPSSIQCYPGKPPLSPVKLSKTKLQTIETQSISSSTTSKIN